MGFRSSHTLGRKLAIYGSGTFFRLVCRLSYHWIPVVSDHWTILVSLSNELYTGNAKASAKLVARVGLPIAVNEKAKIEEKSKNGPQQILKSSIQRKKLVDEGYAHK